MPPSEDYPEKCRIVDINTLANLLWCRSCDVPLSLKHIIRERRCGLGSILTIKCTLCNKDHIVCTHKISKNTYNFSIHLKAAFGILFQLDVQYYTIIWCIIIKIILFYNWVRLKWIVYYPPWIYQASLQNLWKGGKVRLDVQ